MGVFIKKFNKQRFLELLSSGLLEEEALAEIDMPKGTYIQLLLKDPDFKESVANAKKDRADVWFGDIVKSTRIKNLTKEEVAAEKLKFEQRKYLASIDNPDKYAEKRKSEIDVNVNIFNEMKELPTSRARELLLNADPFNQPIPTTFTPINTSTALNNSNSINSSNSKVVDENGAISTDGEEEDIFS